MMHFPPCFRFPPLFSKHFLALKKIFTILPFPVKFLDFHPPKFLMTFFSHLPQISNFTPIFAVSVHFPLFHENYSFPPYFDKISPSVLHKFTCFLHTLHVFRFPPYFYHDAFMHHQNARTGRPCFITPPDE